MTDKVINRKTSKPWAQRKLFEGDLSLPLANSSPKSKASHIASVSSEFFETLAVSVLGGRRGAVDGQADICPDLHIKRGSEPTLVEVKGGTQRRYFKCDTRQLVNYKGCGERVEYAFACYWMDRGKTVGQMADTIGDLYGYFSKNIYYMVVVDISVIYSAWKAGVLAQRKYESWSTDRGGFDSVYADQKFLRQIIENGVWDTDLKRLPELKWSKRQRRASSVEVAGVKFKVNSFPLVELVRPDSAVPF